MRPIAVVVFFCVVVVFAAAGFRRDKPIENEQIVIDISDSGFTTSSAFLGVAIDAAMLTNGAWWDSDGPSRPVNLGHPQLVYWGQLLAPAWLRLGGTEADRLLWLDVGEQKPSDGSSFLHKQQLNDYLNFTRTIGAKPFITTSTGPNVRKNKDWQSDQLTRLLSWLPDDFDGHIEFGNEISAHWLMFGVKEHINFERYTREYIEARDLVDDRRPNIQLAGPANAFWPSWGEPLNWFVGSSKSFLASDAKPDIFTWHYYPTQSRRCGVRSKAAGWGSLLDVQALDEFERQALEVRQWVRDYSPKTTLWLGETGPAQCGGVDGLTDRFGASLWWLNHLGVAARSGNQVVIRQSLIGADYALLAYHGGDYSPMPDFWASLLWRKNMSSKGRVVPKLWNNKQVNAYVHCHPVEDALSLLVVNASSVNVSVQLPIWVKQAHALNVSSGGLDQKFTYIGRHIAELVDWQGRLPWEMIGTTELVPKQSYTWFKLPLNTQAADFCEKPL